MIKDHEDDKACCLVMQIVDSFVREAQLVLAIPRGKAWMCSLHVLATSCWWMSPPAPGSFAVSSNVNQYNSPS